MFSLPLRSPGRVPFPGESTASGGHPRGAFTLVELLVVVTIIGTLAALLLPAISGAKESGHRVKCMGNLRQLMAATILYANDHNGDLPFPNWGNSAGVPGWLYDPPGRDKPEHVETGQLWPYLRNRDVYKCPADRPTAEVLAARDQKISQYTMNGAVCGYRWPDEGKRYVFKLNQFAGNAVSFWCQEDGPDSIYMNDGSNYPNEGSATKRHKDGSPVVCFDGHVEYLKNAEYTTETEWPNRRFWCDPQD